MKREICEEEYFRGYAEINLDAIYKNVYEMKTRLNKNTGVVLVIKTDGYGHGAVPIAKALDDLCYGYAVATPYEGNNLRNHGLNKPTFLLGYADESSYDMIIEKELIPAIFSLEMATKLSKHAQKLGKEVKINIAVDTGMSRIGYIPGSDAVKEIVEINKLPFIKIESIFTHFAKADYVDKSFADKQFDEFVNFVDEVEKNGVKIPIHQCANSAAMMEMPKTSLSLSRAGISMYGLYPSDEMSRENMKLYPALSLHSHVVYVKTIKKGRGISYGQTYIAPHDMKIATIPPANPLLYKFMPPYTIPTFRATEECRNPARSPMRTPNSPAIGASVVENKSASIGDGELMVQRFVKLAKRTPNMIGAMFRICFPVAENPTIVKIPPIVGPFNSPPTPRIKIVANKPLTAILRIVAAPPLSRR